MYSHVWTSNSRGYTATSAGSSPSMNNSTTDVYISTSSSTYYRFGIYQFPNAGSSFRTLLGIPNTITSWSQLKAATPTGRSLYIKPRDSCSTKAYNISILRSKYTSPVTNTANIANNAAASTLLLSPTSPYNFSGTNWVNQDISDLFTHIDDTKMSLDYTGTWFIYIGCPSYWHNYGSTVRLQRKDNAVAQLGIYLEPKSNAFYYNGSDWQRTKVSYYTNNAWQECRASCWKDGAWQQC